MNDILRSNFLESINGAQRSIYLGSVISLLIYVLALKQEVDNFTMPFLDIEVEGTSGLLMLFLFYFAIGFALLFFVIRAEKNLMKLSDSSQREALLQYPSFACGGWYTQLCACLFPVFLFFIAMKEAYGVSLMQVGMMTFVFSILYFVAAWKCVRSTLNTKLLTLRAFLNRRKKA